MTAYWKNLKKKKTSFRDEKVAMKLLGMFGTERL